MSIQRIAHRMNLLGTGMRNQVRAATRGCLRAVRLAAVLSLLIGLCAAVSGAIAPPATAAGANAVQPQPYCTANSLAANDDSSTAAVDLPFPVNYFGQTYQQTYVNNNGNITFGGSSSTYTPYGLTGATAQPIIAPFFADVDTRGTDSKLVTYGSSPDHKTFCVNWVDVGYYNSASDKLNSFQLLLIDRSGTPGAAAGDFDIVFNYDRTQWETGDASGGSNGLGGNSAHAGYSAGAGVDGTFLELPGSGVNGALLDGGSNALIASSRNSLGQIGRYLFPIRGSGSPIGGALHGTVTDGTTGVPDAVVQVCDTNTVSCVTTRTDNTGGYSESGLSAGVHHITVSPPSGTNYRPGTADATVVVGDDVQADIVLRGPAPMPAGTTITPTVGNNDGVPSVYYTDPLTLQTHGCADGTGTYALTLHGAVIRSGPMTNNAGVYTAVIAPTAPEYGAATVSMTITCGGTPSTVTFDLYIDPSGNVTAADGTPIAGATVTLARSDTVDGTFTTVPSGDAVMSPGNRVNPDTTDAAGHFGWDVVAGYYTVSAQKAGCHQPGDSSTPRVTSAVLTIPPAVTDVHLVLKCDGTSSPAPTTTTVAASAQPTAGTPTTLTATVDPTPDGGTVAFSDGGTVIGNCGAQPVAGGKASCITTFTAAGEHPVTATYTGDAAFGGSAGTLHVQVAPVAGNGPADLQVTVSGDFVNAPGHDVVTTVTVTNRGPGTSGPTSTTFISTGLGPITNGGGGVVTNATGLFPADVFTVPFLTAGQSVTYTVTTLAPPRFSVGLALAYTPFTPADPDLFNNWGVRAAVMY